MINTAIGISSKTSMAQRRLIHEWMYEHGLQPYEPHLAWFGSANLFLYWHDADNRFTWPAIVLDELRRWRSPMLMSYGYYWYGELKLGNNNSPNHRALRCTGVGNQDEMSLGQMTDILARQLRYLHDKGITNPWVHFDEPPHAVDGNPGRYGWTPTVEARIIKFATALTDAGWTVGVTIPHPAALEWWQPRLPMVQRWILTADNTRAAYEARASWPSGEVWLYNYGKPGAVRGPLAEQLREFGANGYLHWSATWPDYPLLDMDTMQATEQGAALLQTLDEYEPGQPLQPQGGIYQIFLTNAVEHFQAERGLAAIPGWADRAEVQIEFARTETDRTGARFGPVGSPGQWLESKGVEVWYYVNPVAPVLLATQTRILNEENPQESPFWFRVRQANAIIGNDWILRDAAGQPVIGNGRKRAVADIGNPAYIAWLSDAIIKTGVKRVRLDDYNVHQHAFHRPQRASWQDGNDSAAIIGMQTLCDNLRAAGVRVAANGAWEMSNPDANPDLWQYPLMGHVDGVMIELLHKHTEGKANTGFARWSDGKFWTMDALALANVIEHWQQAGADVTLAVTWRGGPEKYEDFARRWYDDATIGRYWLFTGDDVTHKATHQVDTYPLPVITEPPADDANTPLALIMAEIQAGRGQLHAIEADVLALRERLAIIEQLAAGAL